MSIVHSLISLRAMALAALYEECPVWPEGTAITGRDISIGQQSLTGLAEQRRTPCLFIAPSGPSVRGAEYRTVVVATVLARTPRGSSQHPAQLTVDCDLRPLRSRILDVRALRSPNARHREGVMLRSADHEILVRARLPRTCAPGDLLAIACEGAVPLGQITPRSRPVSDEDEQWYGRCLR